jgi:hypothetical protein
MASERHAPRVRPIYPPNADFNDLVMYFVRTAPEMKVDASAEHKTFSITVRSYSVPVLAPRGTTFVLEYDEDVPPAAAAMKQG